MMLNKVLSVFGALSIAGGLIGAFVLYPSELQSTLAGPLAYLSSVAVLVGGAFWGVVMLVGAAAADDLHALRVHFADTPVLTGQ